MATNLQGARLPLSPPYVGGNDVDGKNPHTAPLENNSSNDSITTLSEQNEGCFSWIGNIFCRLFKMLCCSFFSTADDPSVNNPKDGDPSLTIPKPPETTKSTAVPIVNSPKDSTPPPSYS